MHKDVPAPHVLGAMGGVLMGAMCGVLMGVVGGVLTDRPELVVQE